MRVLGLSLLALAACGRPGEHTAEPLPPAPLVTATLPDPRSPPLQAIPATAASVEVTLSPLGAVSLSEVRMVSVAVTVVGAPSGASAALELSTPQGALYQRQAKGLAGPASQTLSFDFPVAGTAIDQTGLSGQWTTRFLVGAEPLATPSFTLPP